MLSKEEVQHIAALARIQLTDQEVEKFQKELGEVLDYFDMLKEIDVAGVAPMIHSVVLKNRKRKDEAQPKQSQKGKALLGMAPDTKDGYLKVKSIL